ncbi:hypothetical protein ACIA8C_10085 [Nocardia sp. NPDC051321]|uniref:hypothetical protein n=1 Tax=Nocardia sp. NPDC051321 TaxID=3364323 RepID=UPI0037B8903D
MLKAVTNAITAPGQCQFPGCTAPVPARPPGKRGAPREYCNHPDHTAGKALRLKQKLTAREARTETAQPPLRPVTDGVITLAGLLDRYEQLRTELAAVADDAAEMFSDLTDPATVEREIAEVQREATARVDAAEQERDDARKALAAMERQLRRAVELEQLALAAAEEAEIAREEAVDRLAEVEQDAAERIAAAEKDRDEVYTEAETVLTEMRGHVDAASAAQSHAEGQRDTARQQHNEVVKENKGLRAQLDATHADYREQLERRDVEYSRAITAAHAMADRAAREHRDQLSEIIRRYAGDPSKTAVSTGAEEDLSVD